MADPQMYIKVAANIADLKAAMAEARVSVEQAGEAAKSAGQNWQSLVSELNVKDAIENPLSSAKAALSGFVEQLGPMGTVAIEAAGAVTAFGVAIYELANRAAATGGHIQDMSEKTGMSVPALSRLSLVAQVAGTDLDTLSSAFFMLQRNIGDGSPKLAAGLSKIGLSVDELKAAGVDNYLTLIAEHFAATADPATRASAAVDIFNRQGREIIPTLLKMSEAAGQVADIEPWTAEQARSAEQFEMQMASIKIHLESYANALGRNLIEPVGSFISGTMSMISAINEWIDLTGGLLPLLHDVAEAYRTMAAAADVFLNIDVKVPEVEGDAKRALDATNKALDERMAKPIALTTSAIASAERELTEATHHSITEHQKFAATMEELNSAGQGWRGTLNTIDGEVVDAIKYYLEAGVSQEKLAVAYGLTATQIHAIESALKDELAAQKVLDDFQKKSHEIAMKAFRDEAAEQFKIMQARNKDIMDAALQIKAIQDKLADEDRQRSMSTADYAIFQANKAAADRIRTFKGTADQQKVYEELIRGELSKTVDQIRGDNVTLIGGAKDVGAVNEKAAADCRTGYTIAFHDAGGGFAAFKGAVVQGNQEIIDSAFGVVDAYAKVLNAIGIPQSTPGMPRVASSASIAGGTFGRAAGGPVAASVPYMVGERGPELFVPDRAGSIVPNGGGAPVNIHIAINGSVLSDEHKIAAAVGPALITQLRALGMRLPATAR